jgi:hypothetical protein
MRVLLSLVAFVFGCLLLVNATDSITPTTANWPFVTFYPPVSTRMPVFDPPNSNGPPSPFNLLVQVNAPFCHSYHNGTNLFDIFCRATFPSSLNDLPLTVDQVLPQIAQGIQSLASATPFIFSYFHGCATNAVLPSGTNIDLTDTWFTFNPARFLGSTTTAPVPDSPPSCPFSMQCYMSMGLPLTKHSAAGTPVPNPTLPYYCCTTHQTQQLVGAPKGQMTVVNTTQCVFVGLNEVAEANSAECSSGDHTREVCTMTLNLDTDLALRCTGTGCAPLPPSGQCCGPLSCEPECFVDYLCDYTCEFPCVTTPTATQASCSGNLQTGCVPSTHFQACTQSVLSQNPPYCPNNEIAVGFLDALVPVTEDQFETVRVQCSIGTLDCAIECHCYQVQGCANHPNCTSHGTLYESLSDQAIVPSDICTCNPNFFGETCNFQIQGTSCNMGQEMVNNPSHYVVPDG